MMAACVEKRWTLDQLFFEPAFNHFSSTPTVAMVKRKHDSTGADSNASVKKTAKSQTDVHANFGDKLFDNNVVTKYREDYAKSGPYVALTAFLKPRPDTLQLPTHSRLWLDQRLSPPFRPSRDY
jgi:hypothetical protein